jgi:hypothetical protein
MTQEVPEGQPSAQPPPGWPYGDPPPPAGGVPPSAATEDDTPGKRKPSRWWYVVGVGLIVTGVVAMVAFILLAVWQGVTVFKDGTEVAVPGQVRVDLPADDERMLYARPGADPACTLADVDGTDLPIDPTSGSVSISINGDEWVGVGTFPTGSGHVELTCSGDSGTVRIGKVFGGASFVITILLAVFLPIVLGFAGAIVLSVTGVRHYRSRT